MRAADTHCQAEEQVLAALWDKEYLPITGLANFTANAAKLAYGGASAPLSEGRVAITQSISGTGALRIGGEFLARHFPGNKTIFLPTPSWGNHTPIFKDSGLEVKQYRYYNKETVGLDLEGLLADLKVSAGWACETREMEGQEALGTMPEAGWVLRCARGDLSGW
jgi:aspartate aminotransferase